MGSAAGRVIRHVPGSVRGTGSVQSRPNPCGGSIACSSVRSRSQIVCSASAVAVSWSLSGSASNQPHIPFAKGSARPPCCANAVRGCGGRLGPGFEWARGASHRRRKPVRLQSFRVGEPLMLARRWGLLRARPPDGAGHTGRARSAPRIRSGTGHVFEVSARRNRRTCPAWQAVRAASG